MIKILMLIVIAQVVFLVLKLAGVVGWSWWLITLPAWCGISVLAVVCFVVLAGLFLVGLLSK